MCRQRAESSAGRQWCCISSKGIIIMGQTLTDLINANKETLRKGALPYIYQKDEDYAVQRVCKSTEAYRITKTTNGADFRVPIEVGPAGNFGAANLAGAPLGLGRGVSITQFIQTYFATKLAFQLSYDAIKGTATSDQTAFDAWKRTMEEGIPNMARYENASWHCLGGSDGQVGVATAFTGDGTGGTYTLDTDIGVRLFVPNQQFEIINGATYKTGQTGVSPDNLPFVSPGSVNYAARTITFTCPITLTGGNIPAAGDVLYFGGATPSGTPTWAQGLRYVNTTATSGLYLGVNRATYPVINSSAITSGGTLTQQMVLALRQLIAIRTGSKSKLSVIGLVPPHQVAIMSQTVQAMQSFYRTQMTQDQIDPLPAVTIDGGIIFGGITHYQDGMQSATRIDYCNPSDWGRVYLDDKPGADFYKDPLNGNEFFTQYSSNGGPATSTLFYLLSTLNYWNMNPQASGLITGLTPPPVDYTY
jgi:hypothetical protein